MLNVHAIPSRARGNGLGAVGAVSLSTLNGWPSKRPVLPRGLAIVARLAERLMVGRVPECLVVAPVRLDMVRDLSEPAAPHTQRILSQPIPAIGAPSRVIVERTIGRIASRIDVAVTLGGVRLTARLSSHEGAAAGVDTVAEGGGHHGSGLFSLREC